MKVVLTTVQEIEVSDSELALLRILAKRDEYLFDYEEKIAEKSHFVYDTYGEGKYAITEIGRKLLEEIDKAGGKHKSPFFIRVTR